MSKPLVLALGTFDGLHLGHIALIRRTLELSREYSYSSACYTFHNVPVSRSLGLKNIQLMSSLHKRKLLEELGIKLILMRDFNEELMNTEAEDFVREIVLNYNIAHMVVGKDFRFGKQGQGTSLYLKSLGEKYRYKTEIIDFVFDEEGKLSSSRLRAKLREGDMEGARHILGRPYSLYLPIYESDTKKSGEKGIFLMKPDFGISPIKAARYLGRISHSTFHESVMITVREGKGEAGLELFFEYDGDHSFGSQPYLIELLEEVSG